MENYITTILMTIIISLTYIAYKVSKDLETKKDDCPEI